MSICNYFYSFLKFFSNITLYIFSSLGALTYILTHTEVTCFKVISNYQKVVEMYFSSTENFLFHFLLMQSTANRWRPSAKPLRLEKRLYNRIEINEKVQPARTSHGLVMRYEREGGRLAPRQGARKSSNNTWGILSWLAARLMPTLMKICGA